MANINVDTYRYFGRMGGGAALGAKRLKAVVIGGMRTSACPRAKPTTTCSPGCTPLSLPRA